MSAEYATERLMDALAEIPAFQLHDSEPCEDLRSGGQFFEFSLRGKTYEVLVTQVRSDS